MIHVTQGSYAGTISWFKDAAAQVSAHYVIRSSDGQITDPNLELPGVLDCSTVEGRACCTDTWPVVAHH